MNGDVIKSFLLGLGFDVDESSLAKFNKAIVGATIKVAALYTGIQVAAAGIFKGISGISDSFEEMGYSLRLVSPALNKFLILREAMITTYKRAGVDIVKVVQQSIRFNLSLTKTKIALEAVYRSVGAKFLPMLTKQMDIFRKKIFDNMPKIQAALERVVKFIFKLFSATVILGSRLWSILGRVWGFFEKIYDGLAKLDEATGGWSTKIIALAAAWEILNLSFLASPLGAVLAGLVAILALYDDFKTFEEGGKSLFNWSAALPYIHAVSGAIEILKDGMNELMAVVFDLGGALVHLFTLNFGSFKNDVDWIYKDASKAIGAITGLFGGGGGAANVAAAVQPSPLVSSNSISRNQNVNVSHETNILVQGGADANSTGKAVASEQSKVHLDAVRHTKEAIQ